MNTFDQRVNETTGAPDHIRDFTKDEITRRRIVTGENCFACTAGCGSSCGGALSSDTASEN